ncbi:hypothetical protein Tsubulata_004247 [Turnera subulata]|uniref:BRCT domain-containing protein n=1 Tax=Turnera subulata TaxID=218843 RepID=A0A9Q0FVH3_9ROSI|nr:hypothetical protein Tsubulata_004247 [Turnera subulata]
MLETDSPPSKTFLGVRFVLFGFDPLNKNKVRSKLIEGGGIDVSQYTQDCTHVIVDKIVYDDPRCVAARNDGKTLVTGLWVDHSFDIGMPVDPTSIIYRPPKDLNGIPGAKNLIMCLTGYQRQDRDDIMTMVGLMGAQFSKPLVANKVTHLISYKFEGEKYELASKLKRIKLVNHRWLEDCLREWVLLPEDNYSKSGYELEMMEVEARDSEDDAETESTSRKQSSRQNVNNSPQSLKIGTPKGGDPPKSAEKVPITAHYSSELQGLSSVANGKRVLATPGKRKDSNDLLAFDAVHMSPNPGSLVAGSSRDPSSVDLPNAQEGILNSPTMCNDLGSAPRTVIKPSHSDVKFSGTSYSRKTPQRSPSLIISGDTRNVRGSPRVQSEEPPSNLSVKKIECADNLLPFPAEMPSERTELLTGDQSSNKKQKIDASFSFPKSQQSSEAQPGVPGSPSIKYKHDRVKSVTSAGDFPRINNHSPTATHDCFMHESGRLSSGQDSHINDSNAKSSFINKASTADSILLENSSLAAEPSDNTNKKLQTTPGVLKHSAVVGGLDQVDLGVQNSEHQVLKTVRQEIQLDDKEVPHPHNKGPLPEKSDTLGKVGVLHVANSSNGPTAKKAVAKKTLGSRSKVKTTANQKGSIYLNVTAAQNDAASFLTREKEAADVTRILTTPQKGADCEKLPDQNELGKFPLTVNIAAVEDVETNIVGHSRGDTGNRIDMDDETEAPDENDDCVKDPSEKKDEEVSHEAKLKTEKKSEGVSPGINNSAASIDENSKEVKNAAEPQRGDGPVLENVKGNMRRGKKQAPAKTKTKTVNPVNKAKSDKVSEGEISNGRNTEEKENDEPIFAGLAKNQTLSEMKSKKSMKLEKENQQVKKHQNSDHAKGKVGKRPSKSNKPPAKIDASKSNATLPKAGEEPKKVKVEPACFILSGHKLQRKEYQQVIRRLKGRTCRDSHNWSYQATHFIAPDPIKRTEKFFAAAASGRWILKMDYLTACSQAGKFLAEEPYEWHKSGLSEDGAINLEAPRKWRLLRERTGHGAFYGMRIVIYGECIAPPLVRFLY